MTSSDPELLKRHLAAASTAAANGDRETYVVELAQSYLLDGLTRRLGAKWRAAEPGVVEAAVAEAADTYFDKASGGGIRDAGGFIYKCASNKLANMHRIGALQAMPLDDARHVEDVDHAEEVDRDRLRAEAIRLARRFVDTLGQENVVSIMRFILDALERGEADLDNRTIADALGLTLQTVRRCKSRGFKRLARVAREHGIEVPNELLPNDDDDED